MQTSHYYALCRQVSTTTYSTTTCRQAIEHDGNFYNIDITTTHLTMCSTLFHSTVRRSSTRKFSKMLLCLIQPLHCWCERMTNAEVTAGCRLALSIYSNASSFSESFSSSLLSFFCKAHRRQGATFFSRSLFKRRTFDAKFVKFWLENSPRSCCVHREKHFYF